MSDLYDQRRTAYIRCAWHGHRIDDCVTYRIDGDVYGHCACGKQSAHLTRGMTSLTMGKARLDRPTEVSS